MLLISLFLLFQGIEAYTDGTKELLFVQTMWRHGDRSPTTTFKTDSFQESAWTFGGGGWGQLSPAGMLQHLNLGRMLRDRFVNKYQFLLPTYNSKHIYVRSTDVNRTLISAYSNLLGQYGQDDNSSTAGVDYPDAIGWPRGFVPIPIHTVDDSIDHVGNMEADCPLREEVWNLAKQSAEVQNFTQSDVVQQLLSNLTVFCGQSVDIDNLWVVTNALFIEQIYFNDTLESKNSWFNYDLYNLADAINDQVQLYQNGIFNSPNNVVNGHDVGLLLRKIRGGTLLNDVVNHINLKLSCQGSNATNCHWINNLRNYVYSVHDTTIYAFFSSLLIEEYVIKPAGGYPMYSACVLIELYVDNVDKKPYFKLVYHEQAGAGFKTITQGLDGCPQDSDYCSLDVLQRYADETKPDQDLKTWCSSSLDGNSSANISIWVTIFIFFCNFMF